MKLRLLAILCLLSASATANSATYEVCWNPPTSYEDGTPLLEQDLAEYTLYIDGSELLSFAVVVGTWCYVITVTEPGTYSATMTVTDIHGVVSDFSNAATFTIGPRTPGAPTNLTVTLL